MKTGVFHGVTTNPHLLKQAGVVMCGLPLLAERILELGSMELFLQSWGEWCPLHHRLPGARRDALR